MRALVGILVALGQITGVVLFLIGVFAGDVAMWLWGLALSFIAFIIWGVLKRRTAAERQGITERAVRGLGTPPPPIVQKQLWTHAMRATMDRSAPSTSVIENYETLCRMWVAQQNDFMP